MHGVLHYYIIIITLMTDTKNWTYTAYVFLKKAVASMIMKDTMIKYNNIY